MIKNNNSLNYMHKLWDKGRQFLGCEYSILCGAMTWVSEKNLVSAISNAGGFGIIACGSMTPELLKDEISGTRALTDKPFGVNLITMHPLLEQLVDVCYEEKVTHIFLAGGIPPSSIIKRIKDYKIKVIAFAPSLLFAKKLIKEGVDALIIEGNEAGGHIGPVSTNVLAQEILPHILSVPIFVAGGIGRGETIINYLMMGAAGVQLGTRFVCAYESKAHSNFKRAFIHSQARDAVMSVQLDPRFPVIPVRAIANKASQDFLNFQREMIDATNRGEIELKEAQLKIEHFWVGALRKAAVDGNIEEGSLMAGQSVGMITKEQSAKEIIQELVDQGMAYMNAQNSFRMVL